MFRRGDVWWTVIRQDGRKIQKSLETTDKKLAQQIEAKIRTQLKESKYFDKLPGETKTARDLMERYIEEHLPKVVENTRKRYRSSVNNLLPYFGDFRLTEVTPKVIAGYKRQRYEQEVKPATINRDLNCMSKAFNLAVREWEWVRENPFTRVSKEREDNTITRWLTTEEETALLDKSPQWLKEIVTFALNTGMRQDEILSLEWPDINLFRKTANVRKGKNKEPRTVPLTTAAIELLKARSAVRTIGVNIVFPADNGEKLDKSNLGRAFRQAMKKAGITNFRFHDLRHTFASRLAQRGVDVMLIARLLGHRTLAVVLRYAHHSTESLRRGVEVLESDYNLTTVACDSSLVVR